MALVFHRVDAFRCSRCAAAAAPSGADVLHATAPAPQLKFNSISSHHDFVEGDQHRVDTSRIAYVNLAVQVKRAAVKQVLRPAHR